MPGERLLQPTVECCGRHPHVPDAVRLEDARQQLVDAAAGQSRDGQHGDAMRIRELFADRLAQVFQQLAAEQQFIHVVIARHRPQSNGIAERFVRTLKEWLADKVWTSAQELTALLAQFRSEYNDRPHQGLGIPGLSPHEFAERIWLM